MVGFADAGDATKFVEHGSGRSFASAEATNAINRHAAEVEQFSRNPSKYSWESYAAHSKAVEEADKRADSGFGALLSLAGASGMFGPAGQGAALAAATRSGADSAMGGPSRLHIGSAGQGTLGYLSGATFGMAPAAASLASEGARKYIQSQQVSPGYQLGNVTGSATTGAAAVGALGAYIPGYAAFSTTTPGLLLEGGALGAVEGGLEPVSQSAIQNTELTAEQILAGAGKGALLGMVPGALHGVARVAGAGARAIGLINEAKLATSPNEVAFSEALRSQGINPEEFISKLDTPPNGFRTAGDIKFGAKVVEDAYSRVANDYSRAVKSREVMQSGARANVQAARSRFETFVNGEEAAFARGEAVPDQFLQVDKSGFDKVLSAAEKMDGGVSGKTMEGLKSIVERLPMVEQRGGKMGLALLKYELDQSISKSVPKELGDKISGLSKRMADLDYARGLIKEMTPAGVVRAPNAKGETPSPLGIASLFYGIATGNPISLAYGALRSKMVSGVTSAIAERMIPTAVAGERFARAAEAAGRATRYAAGGLAASVNTESPPDQKPITRTLSRDELVDAVDGMRKIVEHGPDASLLNKLGPGFSDTMSAKATAIASNVTRKAAELGVTSTLDKESAIASPYGPVGALMEGRQIDKATKRIREHGATPSEMLLWEYTRTALDPARALSDIKEMSFTNTQLESLRDNYPSLLQDVVDNLLSSISKQASTGKVPALETRARLAKLVGGPVDITTDPKFASQVGAALAPPEQEEQDFTGSTGRAGNPRISENGMTESERLESK